MNILDKVVIGASLVFICGCVTTGANPATSIVKWQTSDVWCNNSSNWETESCVTACTPGNAVGQATIDNNIPDCEARCAEMTTDMEAINAETNGTLDFLDSDADMMKKH